MIVAGYFAFVVACITDVCTKTRVGNNPFPTEAACVDNVVSAMARARPLPGGVTIECNYGEIDSNAPVLQERTIEGEPQPPNPLPDEREIPSWTPRGWDNHESDDDEFKIKI